jgi:uncharacterized protein (TIGR02145 family)
MEYFTDSRDGQKYRTVKICGLVWMAENLNYKTGDSWCYKDDDDYSKKYGRLYTWDAAKTACPAGWRLPTRQEWDTLVTAMGGLQMAGKKLKAKSGWSDNGNGTDDYGFSALPGGRRFLGPSAYLNATYEGVWWTATKYDSDYAYARGTECDRNDMYENHDNLKENGFSVRCVSNSIGTVNLHISY